MYSESRCLDRAKAMATPVQHQQQQQHPYYCCHYYNNPTPQTGPYSLSSPPPPPSTTVGNPMDSPPSSPPFIDFLGVGATWLINSSPTNHRVILVFRKKKNQNVSREKCLIFFFFVNEDSMWDVLQLTEIPLMARNEGIFTFLVSVKVTSAPVNILSIFFLVLFFWKFQWS